MIRTSFLIDGFNLYHSVKTASHDLGLSGSGTRWLDIRSMCQSYLHLIDTTARLSEIYYFSALAKHLEHKKPDVTVRHQTYIRCLAHSGVNIELHRFKKSPIACKKCGQTFYRQEEKETDVAMATRMLELLFLDQCDVVALVTGDTDIVPAVKTALKIFPNKEIVFLMPTNVITKNSPVWFRDISTSRLKIISIINFPIRLLPKRKSRFRSRQTGKISFAARMP